MNNSNPYNQSYNNQSNGNMNYYNQNYNNQGNGNVNYYNQSYNNQSNGNVNYYNKNYNAYGNQQPYNQNSSNTSSLSWLANPSTILGLISALLLTLGLICPAMDFSHFHEQVDIQYNLMKICKNVGLISSMWSGIPYGIIIGIVALVILSFTKIPVLKILPSLLITAMVVLMAVDSGNIIDWAVSTLERFNITGIVINYTEIAKSSMYGIYLLAAGLITSYVSCFFKIKD